MSILQKNEKVRAIDLRAAVRGSIVEGAYDLIGDGVEKFFGVKAFNAAYRRFARVPDGGNRFSAILRALRIRIEISPEDAAKIPASGPLLVVANRPYGESDALALGSVFSATRPDCRLLSGSLVCRIGSVGAMLFPLNPFSGRASIWENAKSRRAALRHLKSGGCLAMFPGGDVSRLRPEGLEVADPEWRRAAGRFARHAEATVLPVYFEGVSGPLHQAAWMLNPVAGASLLLRELMSRRASVIRMRVGDPVPFKRLAELRSDSARTEFLRLKTYLLEKKSGAAPAVSGKSMREPVIDPVPLVAMLEEMEKMPAHAFLNEAGDFKTFVFNGESSPAILREIGRLREVSFREVGAGTGKSCDLDAFDSRYEHLVLWDKKENRVAGAYRVGRVDRIVGESGPRGLYTATLFDFQPELFSRLGPALEMGRSFIIRECRRKPQCLPLLWKAIATLAVRYDCTRLFGPVSVSADYTDASRDLILNYLRRHRVDEKLAGFVRAKNPPRKPSLGATQLDAFERSVTDFEQVSDLVSSVEIDRKPPPVLLKHYLRLNGRMLSFHIDPTFSGTLVGLVLVDLLKADPRFLINMMGADEYRAFRQKNGDTPERVAA